VLPVKNSPKVLPQDAEEGVDGQNRPEIKGVYMRISIFLFVGLTAACGTAPTAGDSPSVTASQAPAAATPISNAKQDSGVTTVASPAKLPTCDGAAEGTLAYVRSERSLMICEGADWVAAPIADGGAGKDGRDGRDGKDGAPASVDIAEVEPGDVCAAGGAVITPFVDTDGDGLLGADDDPGDAEVVCDGEAGVDGEAGAKGAKGEAGAKGDKGDKGDAGADGTDNHIVMKYVCTGAVRHASMASGTPTDLSSTYQVFVDSSGDARAWAQIAWGDIPAVPQTAGYGQIWTAEYSASEAGAETAIVSGLMNWNTGPSGASYTGRWTFTLDRANDTAQAKYDDPDMTPTSVWFTHTCTKTTF